MRAANKQAVSRMTGLGQSMPEEMIKLTTERSQEISSAYEAIQKERR